MSGKEDSKVTWLTCPDCGAKIGIIVSVGKVASVSHAEPEKDEPSLPPVDAGSIEAKLREAGVDTSLLNIDESGDPAKVSPKKFLGDLWGPINEVMRGFSGVWVREGRDSRWEIKKNSA